LKLQGLRGKSEVARPEELGRKVEVAKPEEVDSKN